jgi:hypothetical protein
MIFLANQDSLSRSRVSQCYHISRSRFLNLSRFLSLKSQKSLYYVEKSCKFLRNLGSLDKSRRSQFVLTILINILTKINLDGKISTEKKKVDLDVMDNLDTSKKYVSTRRTFSISTVETPRVRQILYWNVKPLQLVYCNDF